MSMRLEMLQVARLAPKLLGESTELVRAFLLRQQNPDGGFKDRSGRSDLYYTVFGLEGLIAVELGSGGSPGAKPEMDDRRAQAARYLQVFGEGDGLDFVHLCCLARGWGTILHSGGGRTDAGTGVNQEGMPPPRLAKEILRRIEGFRSSGGGYSPARGGASGTAYAAFLALGAYQDFKANVPEPAALARSFDLLRTGDGVWANDRNSVIGSTNATAAAITALRNLSVPAERAAGDWLLARCHPEGGFRAAPNSPLPDLLSTATALHALAGMPVSFEPVRERCLDFIDTLWTNEGGFYGHWGDEHLDCEYTYYGLLALGHLSL